MMFVIGPTLKAMDIAEISSKRPANQNINVTDNKELKGGKAKPSKETKTTGKNTGRPRGLMAYLLRGNALTEKEVLHDKVT